MFLSSIINPILRDSMSSVHTTYMMGRESVPIPASLLCYPDRSAVQSPLPCQTAHFGADEWPVVLSLESSWLGFAAPESVSDSTWCPLQTPLSWPAGGRTGHWGAEAGLGWSWEEVHSDS